MLAQNISAERHIRMLLLFSHVWLFATPWTASHQASLSFTISWSLLKLTSVELVMPSNHLILFHPLLLSSIFPSTGVFSNESALCIRWPKYRSFRFRTSVLSMNIQGWFPLGIDWFDLLAIQGTLKGPAPQFKSINSSACSLLYGPTLTSIHDYRTNYSFLDGPFLAIISLLFHVLSRFVIAFLPWSKSLLTAVTIYRDFGAQEH